MSSRNSKKRRGVTTGDEGKGKKTTPRHHPLLSSNTSSEKGDPSGSRPATNRKGGKSKSAKAKVDLNGDADNFQISIPLSSSAAGPSSYSNGSGGTPSFSPSHFATSDNTMYSPVNYPTLMSYHNSTTDNSTVSYNNVTNNHGHVNWPSPISTGSFFTHFDTPHSPIASLAPHSTHTLPFTSLSHGSNEDVSIHNSSSLPYYYPPEWNRDDQDMPEWSRVDRPEWNRSDFVDNTTTSSSIMRPSHTMNTTNPSPAQSPSILSPPLQSPWQELLNVSVPDSTTSSQAGTTSTMSSTRGVLGGVPSSSDRTDTARSMLHGIVPTVNDSGDVRVPQSRRDSTGQHRRQGTSSPSTYYNPRLDSHLPSSRTVTARLEQSGRITPDVLGDEYLTRRRSARICLGRSRLDVLQHGPGHYDAAGASGSSSLLESDNSPVLPLEDIAGILSDIERNNSGRPSEELQSSSSDVTTGGISTPTTATAGLSQPINNSEGGDVITISSDEEPEVVHVEPQRSTRHHRRQHISDDGDVGPSTTQIERDEEYARRLQEELYHETSSPLHRPEHAGSIPVYPPNLHPWSPGVYFIPNMETLNRSASRHMRNNRDLLAAGIHNWNEGGARSFLARALSSRRRGQRRPTTRRAIMSHISHLPPALLLSSLLGAPVADGLDYEQLLELADRLGSAKSQGLKKEEIERLSTRVYKGKGSSDSLSCVVCMSDYEAGDKLRVLLCSHEYHMECIDQWLKENRTCPICRLDTKLLSDN